MILNSDFGKRRVVIYARVSTEHEAQISALENQLDWYKPILAARPEWELVGQYIDEGITGTSAEKRPQFMKMIRDAKQKKFDMIITREVSRFARNTVDTLKYTRELKEKGVEVYFLNDNIKTFDGDGELRLTIMATLAQDESRKTSVRVKSGQLTSMQNGTFYGNGNILGYRRHEEKLDGGKKQVDFIIDTEQAETVRLMFNMYLNGCGLMQIKNELERRGRKTAMGKEKWHVTNISHVLQNTFYCGIITYRKEYVPDYLTQKKIRNHGEIEKLQVKGKHEPIISVEDFERVQAIMESKRSENPSIKTGKRIGKNPRTIVWGKLLICECGHRFSLRRWQPGDGPEGGAYLCYSIVHNGSYESRKKRGLSTEGYCKTPMVPLWKLQMMAKHIFRNYLSQKDKVLELANSMLEAHIGDNEELVDNSAQIEDYKRELERVSRRIDNLIEMRSDGEIDKADFIKRKTEAEQKHMELQNKIAELEAEQNKTTPVTDYKEKLEVLRYALEQYTNFDEDGDIPDSVIEAFVEKIVVSKDGFDWYLRFDGDPNDPLHLKTEGKRRKNTTIIDPNMQTVGEPVRDTGSHQRKQVIADFIKQSIPADLSVGIFIFVVNCFVYCYNENEVNIVEYLPIILLFIVAIFLCFLPLFTRKSKSTQKTPNPQGISEYDSEGYNRQGYNEVGRNRQGKYNRFYNVKCYKTDLYSEEGFLDIRKNPLYLTNHARDRMRERMGIRDSYRMDELAFEAYQFGKSKLQLMKSERGIIEDKEQEYGDSVILIYRGFCYVFTENNGLKTVYKNDRVKA